MQYFDEVSESEMRKAYEGIKASKGKVVLIVHPFDPIDLKTHPDSKRDKETKEYQEALFRAMQSTKLPIIVFEEFEKLEKTQKRFAKLGVRPLFLPTIRGFCILNERGEKSLSRDPIIRLLSSLGVKNAFIGGAYASSKYNETVWEHEAKIGAKKTVPSIKTISMGCAGGLYRDMIGSGKLKTIRLMPNLLYGDKPKRIKTKTNVVDRRRRVIKRKFLRQINAHLFRK